MKKLTMGLFFIAIATTTAVNSREIKLSGSIENSQRKSLERDLGILKHFQFSHTPDRTLEILGLNNLTNETAYEWLSQRVGYIVEDQNFDKVSELAQRNKVYIEETNVDYSYFINLKKNGLDEAVKMTTVMSNIGTGIYNWGKVNSIAVGFRFSNGRFQDETNVSLNSPRVGIIQIGDGLFSKKKKINLRKEKAVSNSIARLATFFHEARHSDGHGASLGFYHSYCPVGHDYAGNPACDENLNGPYSVAAVMLVEMTKACGDDCSIIEKEVLTAAALDSMYRVQKTTKSGRTATDWDASPESL